MYTFLFLCSLFFCPLFKHLDNHKQKKKNEENLRFGWSCFKTRWISNPNCVTPLTHLISISISPLFFAVSHILSPQCLSLGLILLFYFLIVDYGCWWWFVWCGISFLRERVSRN